MGKKDKPPKIDMSLNFCNCGTCQQALDTALKVAEQVKSGNDCNMWHMLVNHLTMQILANDIIMRKVAEHGPEIGAEIGKAMASATIDRATGIAQSIIRTGRKEITQKLLDINGIKTADPVEDKDVSVTVMTH